MTCSIVNHFLNVKPSAHMISKYAEKLNMLAEKGQFTKMFPFEAYHRSEKLELTKENQYDFRNQHPQNT